MDCGIQPVPTTPLNPTKALTLQTALPSVITQDTLKEGLAALMGGQYREDLTETINFVLAIKNRWFPKNQTVTFQGVEFKFDASNLPNDIHPCDIEIIKRISIPSHLNLYECTFIGDLFIYIAHGQGHDITLGDYASAYLSGGGKVRLNANNNWACVIKGSCADINCKAHGLATDGGVININAEGATGVVGKGGQVNENVKGGILLHMNDDGEVDSRNPIEIYESNPVYSYPDHLMVEDKCEQLEQDIGELKSRNELQQAAFYEYVKNRRSIKPMELPPYLLIDNEVVINADWQVKRFLVACGWQWHSTLSMTANFWMAMRSIKEELGIRNIPVTFNRIHFCLEPRDRESEKFKQSVKLYGKCAHIPTQYTFVDCHIKGNLGIALSRTRPGKTSSVILEDEAEADTYNYSVVRLKGEKTKARVYNDAVAYIDVGGATVITQNSEVYICAAGGIVIIDSPRIQSTRIKELVDGGIIRCLRSSYDYVTNCIQGRFSSYADHLLANNRVDELLGIIKEKLWGKNSSLEDIKRAALYLAVATKVVHPDTSALLESIYNEIEGYLNTHSPDATTQKYLVFWVTFNRVYTKFFVWINSIKLLANEPYTAAVNKLQSSTDRKEQDLARKLIVQMYEAGHETAIHDLDTGMAQMISELDDNANSRSVYITNWECIVAWHEAGLKPAMQFINQVINEKKDPSNQARLRYRDYS